MTHKILMISSPGGDRGPAIGYKNHLKAFKSDERFEIIELSNENINRKDIINNVDIVWAYVRFHPSLFNYFKSLNKVFIGGPNVLFERGDLGPTDEWEKSYCGLKNLDFHINNSDYYLEHVKKFLNAEIKTFSHEACYDLNDLPNANRTFHRNNDVLIYFKQRINDDKTPEILEKIENQLKDKNLKYKILRYGNHKRDDFISLARISKSCIWLSIEDYCSLAQIESHLCGCPVIGTNYNLTIPICDDAIVDAQNFNSWIEWKDPQLVSESFLAGVEKILNKKDINLITEKSAIIRHSYEKYTQKIFDEVIKKAC